MKFPKDFFFGASTASHQVEGNTYNNWSVWEKKNAKRLSESVNSRYWWMPRLNEFQKEASDPKNYISGESVDHYNRYKEDLKIAKDLGLNAYRFSIEWSRIEPQEGNFVEQEILHYKQMIKYIKSLGITPFVTLWHWTHPVWLEEKGGVLSNDFSYHFLKYTEYVLKHLGEDVQYWITVNEPEVYSGNSFYTGEWPPAQKSIFKAFKSFYTLSKVNNMVYDLIKKLYPNSQVSFAKHNSAFVRGDNSILTTLSVFFSKMIFNDFWFTLTKNHYDYIGLNNYTRTRFEGFKVKNEDIKQNDLGWELYPDSVYKCLVDLKKYNKPIVITENGLADAKDVDRGWYITEVFKAMEKALNEGVDLRGYLHWSLLDNFEWSHGYWPKFGLIEVNRRTQERKMRNSGIVYSKLIGFAKSK